MHVPGSGIHPFSTVLCIHPAKRRWDKRGRHGAGNVKVVVEVYRRSDRSWLIVNVLLCVGWLRVWSLIRTGVGLRWGCLV